MRARSVRRRACHRNAVGCKLGAPFAVPLIAIAGCNLQLATCNSQSSASLPSAAYAMRRTPIAQLCATLLARPMAAHKLYQQQQQQQHWWQFNDDDDQAQYRSGSIHRTKSIRLADSRTVSPSCLSVWFERRATNECSTERVSGSLAIRSPT